MHKSKWCGVMLTGLIALSPLAALADADSVRNKGAAWLLKHQRGDGSWANAQGELDVQSSSAAVLALKNAGLSKSPSFGSAVGWLGNADADSIDSIARKVEGLSAAGLKGAAQTAVDRLYGMRAYVDTATWGAYGGAGVDHVDTALGLGALRLGDANYASKLTAASDNTIRAAVCELMLARVRVSSDQQAWAATESSGRQGGGQSRPSVMVTALLLNELRSIQTSPSMSGLSCNSVTLLDLQTQAQSWLLSQQNDDGGFGEQRTNGSKGASSPFVTALVYRALNSQAGGGVQPQTNQALAWLLSQQDAAGSWRNDPFVTATVVAVLPAAAGSQLTDSDGDGLTDWVEQQLGSNPRVADARMLLAPPTLSTPGTSTPALLIVATVGRPFSYNLSGTGVFSLASGVLPPGLDSLSSSGLISGTPQQVGRYGFIYQITHSSGTDSYVGLIHVRTEPQPTTTVIAADKNPTDKTRLTTLTATVQGLSPQGTVNFYDGTNFLGSVTLWDGDPKINATSSSFDLPLVLPGGFRKLQAVYLGDESNLGSSSPTQIQMVNPDAAAILAATLRGLLK